METDCHAFIKKCHKCQVYANLIHVPPSQLHSLHRPGLSQYGEYTLLGRYHLSHQADMNNGSHFKKEVAHLCEEFKIKHHKSLPYRPQTNGAVEAANKNVKVIISKMTETYKDWSNKLPYALWAYRTSIRASTGATPYSLVYGMEAVLPVELRIPSLRVMMEADLPESE
ncbi:uncharacterized protein LOC143891137 [Tasmannia lanceolata]|uniref:uncharacterized protein LOC143891137 n=1 Tax=Tasmannia lanceolata TaxID=3420 RepID=UPI004062E4D9